MKKVFLTLAVVLVGLSGYAQNNLTLYNMKPIPQKFYANPARHSDAKVFIGVPGASSLYFDFGLTTFRIKDILNAIESDNQGNNTFVVSEFASKFKKKNVLMLNNSIDILSFGFKLKKNYFMFNTSLSSNIRVSFPGDFFQFISEGNGGKNLNRKFDFGFGMDMLQYSEFGFGYSREILKDKLTVGGRVRFIKGLNVINTAKSEFNFTTDAETYDYLLQSDIEINTANSFSGFEGDPFAEGGLEGQEITASEVINQFFSGGNRGTAIDLGLEFTPSKQFTFSASVVNLGKIKWSTNTYNWKSRNPGATYRYSGLELDDALNFSSGDIDRELEELGDTIKSVFKLDENNNSFKTGLFAQFYLAGQYNLTKNHNAGILFHGSFYHKTIDPAITLSWNSKLTRVFGASISYSVANNSFVNAGAGLSINLGGFQTYIVSDNIIGLFAHESVNTINVRTGMNITIGRKEKSKKSKKKK